MSRQQQEQLDAILRQGQLDTAGDVAMVRAAFNELMARVPVPADVQNRPTTIGGVDAVEVTVQGTDADNVIVYFHGGVYVIGTAAASVPLVGDLARRTGAKAFTVDYRLAPEHPYPAAVEDAQAAYEGLLGQGVEPGQIAFAGESAGGGLAVATLLALRAAGTPLPSCAFLMSPYADLTLSGETLAEKQAVDPILTPEGLRVRVPDYVARADASDPLISPIFGDLSGTASASDPGRFARDPVERRCSARGTGGRRRCAGHARGHGRRSARVPRFCGRPRRGGRGARPSISLLEDTVRPAFGPVVISTRRLRCRKRTTGTTRSSPSSAQTAVASAALSKARQSCSCTTTAARADANTSTP